MDLNTILTELAKNSPYAVIIVFMMVFFSGQNKVHANNLKEIYQTSLIEIRNSHKEALEELRKSLKYLKDTSKTH